VGRSAELSELLAVCAGARGSTVVVAGPAGVGKNGVPVAGRSRYREARAVKPLPAPAGELVAARLHLSVRTVETHVSSLLAKTGATDRGLSAWLPAEPYRP
jgi:hypothetical protein